MSLIQTLSARGRTLGVLALASGLLGAGAAQAQSLVASVLPGGRTTTVGGTATIFATVINTSGSALSGCNVSLTGYPLAFTYQTTNPATNAPTGTVNTPFSVAAGAAQSMVLTLSPSAAMNAPLMQPVFTCTGATPASLIPGVDTISLIATTTALADVLTVVATPSGDGILSDVPAQSAGSAAFAVATENAGATAMVTVTADMGDLVPDPLAITMCQTTSDGACMAAPTGQLTLSFASGATPTFSVFAGAYGPIPVDLSQARIYVRFTDASGNAVGVSSVAVTTDPSVATAPSGGGIYAGSLVITDGTQAGTNENVLYIVSENQQYVGLISPSSTAPVSVLQEGFLLTNQNLTFDTTTSYEIAAPSYSLPAGGTSSTLLANGALAPPPFGFITALYSTASHETGSIIISDDGGLYDQTAALSQFAGNWNMREGTTKVGTVVFTSTGTFSGTGTGPNNNGCTYVGAINTVNSNYNAQAATVTISGCSLAGTYTGLSAFYDDVNTDDTVLLGLSTADHQQAMTSRLTRF
jgi:hypothetical protein